MLEGWGAEEEPAKETVKEPPQGRGRVRLFQLSEDSVSRREALSWVTCC